ncbi:MAG: hypothetical protein Q8P56_00740, partial [Candidatus Uhrbacteria bacterium]|nr:hypothetical protein [Candidatus Uhrbacteria bacterium]
SFRVNFWIFRAKSFFRNEQYKQGAIVKFWKKALQPKNSEIRRKDIVQEVLKGRTAKDISLETFAFLLSVAATLATPYHFELWWEILRSTAEPLIANVAEWQPALSRWQWQLPVFIGAVIALIGLFRRQLPTSGLFAVALFFVLFMKHIRMVPYFLIALFPLSERAVALLYEKTALSGALGKRTVRMIETGSIALIVLILSAMAANDNVRRPYQPPEKAIEALKSLDERGVISGNVFNEYGFGGWLIYEDPKRLVFIDGRMPHWRDERGYSALEEYLNISKDPKRFNEVFSKYDIHVAILSWEPRTQTSPQPISRFAVSAKKYMNIFFTESRPSLISELEKSGWCRIYEDGQAVILVDPAN